MREEKACPVTSRRAVKELHVRTSEEPRRACLGALQVRPLRRLLKQKSFTSR